MIALLGRLGPLGESDLQRILQTDGATYSLSGGSVQDSKQFCLGLLYPTWQVPVYSRRFRPICAMGKHDALLHVAAG